MENIETFAAEKAENENENPDNPHWNWLVSIGFWILSVLLIGLTQFVFVGLFAFKEGIKLNDPEFENFLKNDPTGIFIQILSVIPAHILTLLAAWFLVTKNRTYSFKDVLGWKLNGFSIWNSAIIIGCFYILTAILIMIFGETSDDFQKILESSKATLYVMVFMATFSAPIVEEVIYRGIIYSSFYKSFGAVTAIIVASLAFASVHYVQYWGNYASLIGITCLSFVLTYIRFKTKNLLPCIILHFLFNGSQSVLLVLSSFAEKYPPNVENPAFHLFK